MNKFCYYILTEALKRIDNGDFAVRCPWTSSQKCQLCPLSSGYWVTSGRAKTQIREFIADMIFNREST